MARQPNAQRFMSRLLHNALDMVYRYRVQPPRGVDYATGAVKDITGHDVEEFYADADLITKVVHPDDLHLVILGPVVRADLWKRPVTLRWVHPDGRIVWAEHQRVPVHNQAGTLIAIEGIARNVTDRVEVQQQLERSQEQLRLLAARLETAREEERAALARELHDELGQTLTALKLELGRTTDALREAPLRTDVIDRLQSIVGLADIGVAMVKRISTRLRPLELEHLGLAEAIRCEAALFRARSGLRCHVMAESDGSTLAPPQQLALFRIFQEALTNVVRHAHASAVRVQLSARRGHFELRVRDNGRGITAAEASDPHAIGLLGMRERATQAGATLTISGRRGRGTVISVDVPPAGRREPRPARRKPRRRRPSSRARRE